MVLFLPLPVTMLDCWSLLFSFIKTAPAISEAKESHWERMKVISFDFLIFISEFVKFLLS